MALRVGERLSNREVGGRFHQAREPARDVDANVDGDAGATRQRRDGGRQPFVREDRWVDAAGEFAQLPDRLVGLPGGGVQVPPEGIRGAYGLGGPPCLLEGERHADQPLLRAVVEVALEPTPLVLGCSHDAGAGLRHRPKLLSKLALEPLVLEREPENADHSLDELGLVAERRVVDHRGERAVGGPDHRDGPPVAIGREVDRTTALGPPRTVRVPAQQLERRIAERDPERRLRRAAARRPFQPGRERPEWPWSCAEAQRREEDRQRHEHAREEEGPVEHEVERLADLEEERACRGRPCVLGRVEGRGRHSEDAGDEDWPADAPQDRPGTNEPQDDDHPDDRREHGDRRIGRDLHGLEHGRVGRDGEWVRRALRASVGADGVNEEQPTGGAERGRSGKERDEAPRLEALRAGRQREEERRQDDVVPPLECEPEWRDDRLPARPVAPDEPQDAGHQERRTRRRARPQPGRK